jgi:hypothetical protein
MATSRVTSRRWQDRLARLADVAVCIEQITKWQ